MLPRTIFSTLRLLTRLRRFSTKTTEVPSVSAWSRAGRAFAETSIGLTKAALIAYCVFHFGIELRHCTGPSMEPTIQDGDIIVIEKIFSRWSSFQRGDIVICRSPSDPESVQCKRILAMPGDILEGPEFGYQSIPEGSVWLQGDNFWDSNDSRVYGPVPMGLLIGRAFFKLNKFQMLK